MNVEQISAHPELVEYIRKFVQDPRFMDVKDAFVAHSPERADTETTVSILFGKGLGTRYVFNSMEEISRTPPPTPTSKDKTPGKKPSGQDPDLAS